MRLQEKALILARESNARKSEGLTGIVITVFTFGKFKEDLVKTFFI